MTFGLACRVAMAVLSMVAPAFAQEDIGFKPIPSRDIVVPSHTDGQVDELLSMLDSLLAREKDTTKTPWATASGIHFWRFYNRLVQGTLTPAQESRILAHFNRLAEKRPEHAAVFRKQQDAVRLRTVGKTAPEIVGKDLDGVEFKLSDYRGKVIVLAFSGDWCGPCRSEYPYQRLLLEVYKDQPFTILSVNSDTLEVAKRAKVEKKLDYRSWWDGHAKKATEGPIAEAWDITGWPTIYVLDHKGTIRFVNLRAEDVIKAVKQLMREVPKPTTPPSQK